MERVGSLGSAILNPRILRLIQWTPNFSTYNCTFVQVWVCFQDLDYDFWKHQTLFEIAKGVGMPVKLDPKPADRSLGIYARILVDVDFFRPLLQQLHVSHSEGDSVIVGIEYETQPIICGCCDLVGHVEL